MKRTATAKWKGKIKEGKGTLETQSGTLSQVPYSFGMRFGDEKGTNPEELTGAAHAGCFAMAMSLELEKRQLTADSIEVKATVNLDQQSGEFAINDIHLDVTASVPGANHSQVEEAANVAKRNCPVSKLLRTNIGMTFHFISQPGETAQTGPH